MNESGDTEYRHLVAYGVLEKKGNDYYIHTIFCLEGDNEYTKQAILKFPKGCVESIKYLIPEKAKNSIKKE